MTRSRFITLFALLAGVVAMIYVAPRRSLTPGEKAKLAGLTDASSKAPGVFKRASVVASTPIVDPPETVPVLVSSNIFERLLAGEIDWDLTPEQTAEYLRQYGTNVETLLATQKRDYIKLAAELFPNDPRVQYAVLARELFPEARREWLDRFKASAPDNAIADYLSAREFLRAGDRDQGIADLVNAMGKPGFNDYSQEQVQNTEDAQLSAGRSLVEAKVAASSGLLLPQLAMFKGLAQDLQKMQKESLTSGDSASAEALAQMGLSLAQRLREGEGSRPLVNQLVGVAVEKLVLGSLPPDSQPAFLGGTVQKRIDQNAAFRQEVRELTPQFDALIKRANETELIGYFDRLKLQGEYKAMLWLRNRDRLRQSP